MMRDCREKRVGCGEEWMWVNCRFTEQTEFGLAYASSWKRQMLLFVPYGVSLPNLLTQKRMRTVKQKRGEAREEERNA